MRKLIIEIEASVVEIDLDHFYNEDEELDPDGLYDGFIHEIITQPEYSWKVVGDDGEEIEVSY